MIPPAIQRPVRLSPHRPPVVSTPTQLSMVRLKEAKPASGKTLRHGFMAVAIDNHRNGPQATFVSMTLWNGWVGIGKQEVIKHEELLDVHHPNGAKVLRFFGTRHQHPCALVVMMPDKVFWQKFDHSHVCVPWCHRQSR